MPKPYVVQAIERAVGTGRRNSIVPAFEKTLLTNLTWYVT